MDGIPAQAIPDAILEAQNTIEITRLWDAVNVAAVRQLITPDEKEFLLKSLNYDSQKAEQLHERHEKACMWIGMADESQVTQSACDRTHPPARMRPAEDKG